MIITEGISNTSITVNIQESFTPKIEYSYYFVELDSNKLVTFDRGESCDYYETTLTMRGTQSEIDGFLQFYDTNRALNRMVFDCTFRGEPVFGANVDYQNAIRCSISNIGERVNAVKDVYTLSFTIVAVTGTILFVPYTGEPLTLSCVGFNAKETTIYDNKFNIAYNTSYHYQSDSKADYGIFEGEYLLSFDQMKAFRNFYKYTRGDTFVLTSDMLQGVQYPFGISRGTYPFNVKFNDMEESYISCNRYSVKISLIEDV